MASNGKYVLDDDGNPLEIDDVLIWGRWFETHDRHVALDVVEGCKVSTVFLGLDHSFGSGPPVLWETMIFSGEGGPMDQAQWRYTSLEDARAGHAAALAELKHQLDQVKKG
jgi:hypothetical protein